VLMRDHMWHTHTSKFHLLYETWYVIPSARNLAKEKSSLSMSEIPTAV
jgi:hypothetical protein